MSEWRGSCDIRFVTCTFCNSFLPRHAQNSIHRIGQQLLVRVHMSAPIRLLDISEPPPATAGDNEPSVLEALTALAEETADRTRATRASGREKRMG